MNSITWGTFFSQPKGEGDPVPILYWHMRQKPIVWRIPGYFRPFLKSCIWALQLSLEIWQYRKNLFSINREGKYHITIEEHSVWNAFGKDCNFIYLSKEKENPFWSKTEQALNPRQNFNRLLKIGEGGIRKNRRLFKGEKPDRSLRMKVKRHQNVQRLCKQKSGDKLRQRKPNSC